MKRNTTVEEYISDQANWKDSLQLLREIILGTDLQETVKWGIPVYTYLGKNVVGIADFKSYVAIWFFQGALLNDNQGKLVNAQEGVTKAQRQWRFASINEIEENSELISAYIEEAKSNQEQGREIKADKSKPLIIPDELQSLFDSDEVLYHQFESLTLTKKREYTDYISEAKREDTKLKRLDKIKPMIEQGIGLNDKYRK